MLSADQLRELASHELVTIGNHTRTHPDLRTVSEEDELEREIVGAREDLESLAGVTVDRFSYPFGGIGSASARIVEQSHEYAVTTRQSLVSPGDAPHRLPRIMAHASESLTRWDLTDLRWRLSSAVPGVR
jgi:peptidoglycan/xylan/chitin deacetylase (PgdA/CDA1 family)